MDSRRRAGRRICPAHEMNRSKIATSRGLWTSLLIVATALTSCIFMAAGIWFALPRESVVSAGYMDEYSWEQPKYIPIHNRIGIFLDFSGDELVALDATSTTSGCRILWNPRENSYIDPCCGGQWTRDGTPFLRSSQARRPLPQPLTQYQVEISMEREILVHPWQAKQDNNSGSC
jgi:hypothetical protein